MADGRSGGSSKYCVKEGFGTRTGYAAEHGALNRGLQFARGQGYEHVTVRGDSELVHKPVTGQYEARLPSMWLPRDETIRPGNGFKSFKSEHVPRAYNRGADSAANDAVDLGDGVVEVYRY